MISTVALSLISRAYLKPPLGATPSRALPLAHTRCPWIGQHATQLCCYGPAQQHTSTCACVYECMCVGVCVCMSMSAYVCICACVYVRSCNINGVRLHCMCVYVMPPQIGRPSSGCGLPVGWSGDCIFSLGSFSNTNISNFLHSFVLEYRNV